MPRKKKVDPAKLVQAIDAGQSRQEIMESFGIKTLNQLKTLYVDSLAELGRIPSILVSRKGARSSEEKPEALKVNKRGSLIVTKEIITELGFKIGDTFSVRKSAAGISLKRNNQ